jgi:putative ABC transport system permease protein
MSRLHGVLFRLRALLGPGRHAREVGEEIDFHLSLDATHQRFGPDGRWLARRRFGNIGRYQEETRAMSGLGFFDQLGQDARFAFRTFRHAPLFTAVGVLTIALGIGATAAIFSVVHSVVLRPLPYPDADRIVMVWMENHRLGLREDFHSYPNLADLKSQNRSLSHLAPFSEGGYNLTGAGEPVRIVAGSLPAEALAVLGARPMMGRLYDAANETEGNDAVVLLSYGLWQSAFGASPSIVGREVELNGRKRTVVGVMPRGFAFPSERTQVWVPLVVPEQVKTARSWYYYPAIGKLAPGVTLSQARADLAAIAERLAEQYPSNRDNGVYVLPLPEQVVGPALRTALWVMLGAVAAVLLIACANVANLLLSRAAVREREVSVRLALGASTRRLVRQLLTESVLLSALGGIVGVLLAWGGLRVLQSMAPSDLPRLDGVGVNGVVLLVTSLVTILTGILFGMAPAAQSARGPLSDALREGGRGGTAGQSGQRLRRTIVAGQLALVVVLLTGAGLLIRTFVTLQQTQLGFRPEGLLTMTLQLPRNRYGQPGRAREFYGNLLERLRTLPGVTGAAHISTLFLSKTPNSGNITIENREPQPLEPEATFDAVSPGFFETLGARLVDGRFFTAADRDSAPPVAVVNQHFARYYWPNGSAIGKRFVFGGPGNDTTQNPWVTVVGVVGDMRRTGLDTPVRNEIFTPHAQGPTLAGIVVVRTNGDPLALASAARAAVREIDKDQPVSSIRTMEAEISRLLAQRRFSMTLVGAFAGLALVLAVIGAYGVTSYLVSQRTREIGVRIALGAAPSSVTRLVVLDGMRVALAGIGLGVLGALLTTRVASALLYGVSPRDPLTLGIVVAVLVMAAAFANYFPARRAARVDPLQALRRE